MNSIHYRTYGTGQPVMLIHGFPESGATWDNIIPALSKNFTCIVPDLPGSGKSALEQPCTLEEMAQSLKSVLDELKISKIVLAGHSMGGYVALAFCKLYPEMIAGLSLVHSTVWADDEEKKNNRRKAIEIIKQGGKRHFLNQVIPGLFADSFIEANPNTIEAQQTKANELTEEGLVNFYEAMIQREDFTETLKKFNFPLQWVLGAEDKLISVKKIVPLTYVSPINYVHIYDGCGHMSMYEAPRLLTKDLEHFLRAIYQ